MMHSFSQQDCPHEGPLFDTILLGRHYSKLTCGIGLGTRVTVLLMVCLTTPASLMFRETVNVPDLGGTGSFPDISDGTSESQFIVMELVVGDTLAGAIPPV